MSDDILTKDYLVFWVFLDTRGKTIFETRRVPQTQDKLPPIGSKVYFDDLEMKTPFVVEEYAYLTGRHDTESYVYINVVCVPYIPTEISRQVFDDCVSQKKTFKDDISSAHRDRIDSLARDAYAQERYAYSERTMPRMFESHNTRGV